ncbi:MAG TPA: hypothetical protein VEO00_05365, partial [Actinomycetota bacterium]|nr:hypothetical protein [Actinomycetota bacterium]
MQEDLLRDSVRRYFRPFSPFYRRLLDEAGVGPRDVRRLSDLQRIPMSSASSFSGQTDPARPFEALFRPDEQTLKRFLHRSLMRRVVVEKFLRGDEAAERVLAEEFKPVHLQLPFAGGPLVGFSMRDLVAMAQAGARMLAVLGLARTDVLVSTLPFDAGLPSWFATYAAQAAGMSAAHLGGGQAVRPSQTASWMARLGATAFVTQPGYAEGLLRAAPASAFAALRVLALWGGVGMLGARARFAELLRASGAPAAQAAMVLSVPETRVAWGECPAPAG